MAIAPEPPASEAARAATTPPYVGLRPYREDERLLFFGRDEDATLLRNKIFASPLTLFYAPSGVGKTSLLATTIIPDIRAQDALVLYFDRWTTDDPTPAIKAALMDAAKGAIAPERAADLSLTEIVAVISGATEKSVVLVFDQFEQFLVLRAGALDSLAAELGALLRASLDAFVVLALREEFLAGLDALRNHIFTLFHSTYRLERLRDDRARAAIEKPAALFDKPFDPNLVDTLLADLTAKPNPTSDGGLLATPGIELPFLQIICEQLWQEAQRNNDPIISLARYRGLGGREGIIRRFTADVTSTISPRRRGDMAELLKFLAPPGGIKAAYSIELLKHFTGLAEGRIRAVLDHLCRKRVIRDRQSADEQSYELYHDAFIPVLSAWSEARLRRRKRMRWSVASAGLFLILGAIGVVVRDNLREDDRRTTGQFEYLRQMTMDERVKFATPFVDTVTLYLLRKNNDDSFDALVELLRDNEDLIPQDYGLSSPGAAAVAVAEPDDHWPITLRYHPDAVLDANRLQRYWASAAESIVAAWGIPLPFKVRLQADPALERGGLKADIRSWKLRQDPTPRTVPIEDATGQAPAKSALLSKLPQPARSDGEAGQSAISETVITWDLDTVFDIAPEPTGATVFAANVPKSGRLHDFLDEHRREWRVTESHPENPLWVPLWTRPIWKVANVGVYPRELAVVRALRRKLEDEPHVALSRDAVLYLLDRMRITSPKTVDEALAARGGVDGVWAVLGKWVERDRNLKNLPYLLDAIADYRDLPAEEAASRAGDSLNNDVKPLPNTLPHARLSGPGIDTEASAVVVAKQIFSAGDAFLNAAPPLRVYFGERAVRAIAADESAFSYEEALSEMSRGFFRRFGLMAPEPEYPASGAQWHADVSDDSILVRLRNETDEVSGDPDAVRLTPASEDAVATVVEAIGTRLAANRAWWLSADSVDALLAEVPEPLNQWLRQTFTLTDLKLILRAVIQPDAMAKRGKGGSYSEALSGVPPDRTLRHLPWLLRSLVFWVSTKDEPKTKEPIQMAQYLRMTHRARLGLIDLANIASSGEIHRAVEQGLGNLYAGRIDAASGDFQTAIASDRVAAMHVFLANYARRFVSEWDDRLDRFCALPNAGDVLTSERPPLRDRFEVEAYVDDASTRLTPTRRRDLDLCLLWSYMTEGHVEHAIATVERLLGEGQTRDWPPQQEYFLGYLYAKYVGDAPDDFAIGARFLESAFERMRQADAEQAVHELAQLCIESQSPRRCEPWLNGLSGHHPNSIQILLDVAAHALGYSMMPDTAQRVIERLDRAAGNLPTNGRRSVELLTLLRWEKAQAYIVLGQEGDRASLTKARELLEALLASNLPLEATYPNPTLPQVLALQARTYLYAEMPDEAARVLDSALAEPLPINELQHEQFSLQLARKAPASAYRLAKNSPGNMDVEWLFNAAISAILVRVDGYRYDANSFILKTEHPYRDYVRMLYYWALLEDGDRSNADSVLRNRWIEIDETNWSERLALGDSTVWPEMLVGYFLGAVARERVFGPLESPAKFAASELGELGLPLAALRCEAYFYDALLQSVSGDEATRHDRHLASLRKVLESGFRPYLEYGMAGYLVDRATGKLN